MELAQQSFFKEGLHISPTIEHAVDCNRLAFDAVEDPVRLVSNLSELGHTDVPQFWRDMSSTRSSAKRIADTLQAFIKPVGPFNRIVQSNITVNVKEVILPVGVYTDIIFFHS